jgi:hypothetical protein
LELDRSATDILNDVSMTSMDDRDEKADAVIAGLLIDDDKSDDAAETLENNISVLSPPTVEHDANDYLVYSNMLNNYGLKSFKNDKHSKPLRTKKDLEELSDWFQIFASCYLVSIHHSGSDALNAAQEFVKIMKNCRKTHVLHLGYYGSFYGDLLITAPQWVRKRVPNFTIQPDEETTTGLPKPLSMPTTPYFTEVYDLMVDYYTNNGVPMPNDKLPRLTPQEKMFMTQFHEYLAKHAEAGNPITTVLLEPVYSHAALAASPRLLRWIATYCHTNDLVLIIDESMTGIRCGTTVFLFQWLGVYADLVVFSKAFYPCAGVVAPYERKESAFAKTWNQLIPSTTSFMDASTYNKVLQKLRIYTMKFMADITAVGKAIRERLKLLKNENDQDHEVVRGVGLLILSANRLVLKSSKRGINNQILFTYKRLLPLLDFPLDMVDDIFVMNSNKRRRLNEIGDAEVPISSVSNTVETIGLLSFESVDLERIYDEIKRIYKDCVDARGRNPPSGRHTVFGREPIKYNTLLCLSIVYP